MQSDKRLVFIDPKKILPPKSSRDIDRYQLFLLSESIREFGLLIPVTVCETEYGYRVISGERRVKACIMAGLCKIPCVVTPKTIDPMIFRAVEERTGQIRDLNEEAELIKMLCRRYSAATVALVLSTTTGELNKITEKRRREEDKNLSIASESASPPKNLVKDRTEPKRERENRLPPIRDVKFLVNSIKQLTESVISGGIKAEYKQKETDKALEIRLRIDKEERRQISLF